MLVEVMSVVFKTVAWEFVWWAIDSGDIYGMLEDELIDALTIGRRHGRHMVLCSTMLAVMKMDAIKEM